MRPKTKVVRGDYLTDKGGNTYMVLSKNKADQTLRIESVVTKGVYKNVPASEFDLKGLTL